MRKLTCGKKQNPRVEPNSVIHCLRFHFVTFVPKIMNISSINKTFLLQFKTRDQSPFQTKQTIVGWLAPLYYSKYKYWNLARNILNLFFFLFNLDYFRFLQNFCCIFLLNNLSFNTSIFKVDGFFVKLSLLQNLTKKN